MGTVKKTAKRKATGARKAPKRKAAARSGAENKTQPTRASVGRFLDGIENETRRRDARRVAKLFRAITGEQPKMWGDSIVGYGRYHYRYASGREGDHLRIGFSPRKQSLVLYIMPGFEKAKPLLARLGKYRTGRACLYVNKLEDVDLAVLEELARAAFEEMERRYPST